MSSTHLSRSPRSGVWGRVALGLVGVAATLAVTSVAGAASVAYIEDGNVWLSSPDGTAKVQLTTDGTPSRPWYTPSQSVDGRTFAVQRMDWLNFLNMRLHTFSAASGATVANVTQLGDASKSSVNRPTSGDVTDDGTWQMHEASYCVASGMFFCFSLPHEGWVTPTQQDWGIMKPSIPPSVRQPTYWGSRVVASDGTNITLGEGGSAAMYGGAAQTWISPIAGLSFKRADVPPVGGKVAVEVYRASPGAGQSNNMISIIPFTGAADPPTLDPANGCDMPQVGNAHSVAWSPDGTSIAWRDSRGLVVSGAPILPSPLDDICRLASPPVVITSRPASSMSADGKDNTTYLTLGGPSFGGADVPAIVAARAAAGAPGGAGTAPSGPSAPRPAEPTLVTRGPVTAPAAASLAAPVTLSVVAARPGTIVAVGRIPAAVARRLKLPVVIARGKVTARRSQKVSLVLRPTTAGRRAASKLKGVTMIVQVTVPGKAPVRVPIKLR